MLQRDSSGWSFLNKVKIILNNIYKSNVSGRYFIFCNVQIQDVTAHESIGSDVDSKELSVNIANAKLKNKKLSQLTDELIHDLQ